MKTTPSWLAAHPAEAGAELRTMTAHDPEMLAHALDAAVLARDDIRDLAASITVASVVLSRAEDNATPPWLGQEIADLIPGAEHHVVDAAHAIPIERSDALISAIATARAKRRANDG